MTQAIIMQFEWYSEWNGIPRAPRVDFLIHFIFRKYTSVGVTGYTINDATRFFTFWMTLHPVKYTQSPVAVCHLSDGNALASAVKMDTVGVISPVQILLSH